MHKEEPHRELESSTDGADRHSSSASSGEGETFQVVPQPPVTIRQPRQQAITIPLAYWRRLERRVATMPETSTIWLALAGALAGVSIERHDESSLLTGAGSFLCYLAHRAIAKGSRTTRADIVEEMRLHDPSWQRKRRQR